MTSSSGRSGPRLSSFALSAATAYRAIIAAVV
jgi:hypothetical protein